jgi:hypothetical protein
MTVEDTSMSRRRGFAEAERLSGMAVADHLVRLEEDPRWAVARRVAGSKGFAKSKFLISFILYICEKHLLDQTGEITEQLIGEHVFRRPQGYNPGEDNIVRNYARLLRQRLDEYFNSEGIDETIRIAVPRGGYVPIFIEEDKAVGEIRPQPSQVGLIGVVGGDSSQQQPEEIVDRAVKDQVLPGRQVLGLRALCAALFLALVSVAARDIHIKSPQQRVSDRFWSVFFSSTRDTLLVPADSGLVIYQDLTNRRISLAEYAAGEYQKHTSTTSGIDSAIVNELGGRRYTSVVDLHIVSSISQLPAVVKNRFKVRYAREVTLDDLKQSNVILLGSFDSNPWVDLFQKDVNFQFEPQPKVDDVVIHNLHPMAGESEYYRTDQSDSARSTFGLIVVTPNLDGTGHVLLIEGINMAGTEAAAEYLFSDASVPLLSKVFDSNGSIMPFEVLLETSNIGANAARPRIISERILQR